MTERTRPRACCCAPCPGSEAMASPSSRGLTDTGSADRSRRFRKALRCLKIRHLYPALHARDQRQGRKSHPDPSARMRLRGSAHPSSDARDADLPRWLELFNRSRPHSALNGLPPLPRVNDLMKIHPWSVSPGPTRSGRRTSPPSRWRAGSSTSPPCWTGSRRPRPRLAGVDQAAGRLLHGSRREGSRPPWRPEIFSMDQGSQFTSTDFIKVLAAREIRISMDGKGGAFHRSVQKCLI